jgi:RND family efflux transporter MFP subunit
MSVRRSIVVLIAVALVLPVIVFGARANRQAAQTPAREIQQFTVTRGDVEVTVSALGTIKADQSAQLSFSNTGRVTERPFNVGDYVLIGDVLARQADDAQRIAHEQALLALDLAVLQRDQLLQPPDEGQIEIAQANVDAAEAAIYTIQNVVSQDDIRAAELSYEAAQQALEDAVQARATASGGQPQQAYALLDARVGEATFNAETARLQLESLRTGSQGQLGAASARLTQAQRELERMQAGATQAEIDRADALIAQAELNVQQAQTALDRMAIIAPFDGYITAINVEIGAIAAPSLPAIEITDISPLRLDVQVDEIDIRRVREGMSAQVRLDALREIEFAAELERIALIGTNEDGIVTYDVGVRLGELDDARVRVGMTAEAGVVVDSRQAVLIVPNLYIRLDRQQNRAYVNLLRANGILEEVEVTLGLQGEESSEVLTGLREGDIVTVDLSGDAIPFLGG